MGRVGVGRGHWISDRILAAFDDLGCDGLLDGDSRTKSANESYQLEWTQAAVNWDGH